MTVRELTERPVEHADPQRPDGGVGLLAWVAVACALGALVVALFGLRDSTSTAAPLAPATVVDITMSEFAFTPTMITIPASGATLRLTNTGSVAHNVRIPEIGVQSADVAPGRTVDLVVGPLTEGHYDVFCNIAGHAEAGMKASLMVGDASGNRPSPTDVMTNAEMDEMMDAAAAKFPAATAGHGGDVLQPTRAADGAKEFAISAEVVQWEVSPGTFVEAWTYNGVVPAPTIRVSTGDRVRLIVTNNMEQSTSVHLHGIRVPNAMDGVDPYTQPSIKPGETFTYEFDAVGPAVGIYHSHHNAQLQVPNGMFGAFLIDEIPIPQRLVDAGVTSIDKEVTMVLNDAGTIGLSLNGKSFPATEPYTLKVGETMLVHYLNEGLMAHPMHLHQPVGWVIAKDGVPLEHPLPGDTINVAPGERYSVLYTAVDPGVWAWHCHILTHAEGPQGMFGMVTALIVEEA